MPEIVVIFAIIMLLTIIGWIVLGQRHFKLQPKPDPAIEALCNAKCPDCGGHLLAGPSGGFSQNAACESCYSEFNVHGECYGYDRLGKLSKDRARIYGITETEYEASTNRPAAIVRPAN